MMSVAKRLTLRRVQVWLGLVLLLSLMPLTTALADPTIPTASFKAKWQRADKPVTDNSANPARSWLWGPETFLPAAGNTEPYTESAGGKREVLYFDKARMEINDPTNNLVTNGLLVRELISGREATGNTNQLQRRAADDIPVAGDPAGNAGPTYASFSKLVTLNNDNPALSRLDKPVSESIDKAGMVGTVGGDLSSKAKYIYFDPNLKHNIPDVFWNFMNQKGTIYQNGQLSDQQPVLGDNATMPWLDATGLPISEAYWAKVTLAGQPKDVLIQVFERRVLTYTPSNPPAFQVEMGNVGRHYFSWRYNPKYDLNGSPTPTTPPIATTPPPTATPTPTPIVPVPPIDCTVAKVDDDTNGAYTYPRCGPAGMEIILGMTVQPGETVEISPMPPDGTHRDSFMVVANDKGVINELYKTAPTSVNGQWSFKFHAQTSNKDAVAYVVVAPPVTKPTAFAYPPTVNINAVVAFVVVGFVPGEKVTAMVSGPNGVASQPVTVAVSDNGGGLTLVFQPLLAPGNWVFHVEAVSDKNRAANVDFVVVEK